MAGNTFGTVFRLTTFGESHGPAIGGIIDGCPAGLKIDVDYVQQCLNRRRPGQTGIATSRNEFDRVEFLSGFFEEKTTGAPIAFIIKNKDHNPADYEHLKTSYRPSHADFTWTARFGLRDHRGGGRSSARETASRVAAGAIARSLLNQVGIKITAWVSSIGPISMDQTYDTPDPVLIESNQVRCPDALVAEKMIAFIETLKASGDTTGGIVSCIITGTPAGLGEPVFDKLQADLAKAMLSINAVKGFEYGSGFAGSSMKGSDHNDIIQEIISGPGGKQKIQTATNYSGGIQGGISNGEPIYFKVAFKPVSTIMKPQPSVDIEGNPLILEGKGRHDVCVVPRAVPIVEAMASLVMADQYLRSLVSRA